MSFFYSMVVVVMMFRSDGVVPSSLFTGTCNLQQKAKEYKGKENGSIQKTVLGKYSMVLALCICLSSLCGSREEEEEPLLHRYCCINA